MLKEILFGNTAQEVLDFTMIVCGGCGIAYMVPTRWNKSKIDNKGSFFCPNGCSRMYTGKTEAEKLKEQLDTQRLANEKEKERLTNLYLDELSAKKNIERKLKRVHNGVCPCCKRSFENLQRHIATKHPELVDNALKIQQTNSVKVESEAPFKKKRGRPRKNYLESDWRK